MPWGHVGEVDPRGVDGDPHLSGSHGPPRHRSTRNRSQLPGWRITTALGSIGSTFSPATAECPRDETTPSILPPRSGPPPPLLATEPYATEPYVGRL